MNLSEEEQPASVREAVNSVGSDQSTVLLSRVQIDESFVCGTIGFDAILMTRRDSLTLIKGGDFHFNKKHFGKIIVFGGRLQAVGFCVLENRLCS